MDAGPVCFTSKALPAPLGAKSRPLSLVPGSGGVLVGGPAASSTATA